MRRHLLLLPLAAALALAASACGSSSGSATGGSGGATIAPASAPVFISIDTDTGSAQWKQADELLSKFPGKGTLLAAIEKGLRGQGVNFDQDVKPALGDELDIVVLDLQSGSTDAVGLLQPKDKAKLDALLQKIAANDPSSKAVSGEYKDWTIVAQSQAVIDKFKTAAAQGALADDATFKDATAADSGEALAKAYVNGSALTSLIQRAGGSSLGSCPQKPDAPKLQSISAALSAESSGVRLHATFQSDKASATQNVAASQLVSQIPSGALLVYEFHGSPAINSAFSQLTSCQGQVKQGLDAIEKLFGVKLSELGALFKKQTALYVRAGSPIPEVTLVSQQDDPQAALGTLDKLAAQLGGLTGSVPTSTQVDGKPAKKLVIGGRITIYYAALDGEVVVTDSEAAIHDLTSSGPKLKDDTTFKEAQKASGMPDQTSTFLYVDFKDSIPLVESLVQLGGTSVPDTVDANLRPLQTFVLYGTGSGAKGELTAFLELK
jgi:hypothetical protein